MDEKMSRRFTTLGFLMTCVIAVFHCGNGNTEPICEIDRFMNDGIFQICTNLALIAMSYFFVTSGYLFFRDFTLIKYFKKIRKRIVTLLLPYIIWQFIFGIKMILEGGKEAFVSQTFLLDAWPPNGPLWYMYAVFILMLLSPLFWALMTNRIVGVVSIIAVHVISRIVFGIDNEVLKTVLGYGYISNLIYYLPSFCTGAYLGIGDKEEPNENIIKSYIVIAGLIFVVMGFVGYDDINFFQSFMGELLSVLLIYLLPAKYDCSRRKVVNVTFFVYAIHDSVDTNITPLLRGVLVKICSWASFVNIAGRALSLIMVIVIAFLLWMVLEKVCPRMLSVLSGGRVKKRIKEAL